MEGLFSAVSASSVRTAGTLSNTLPLALQPVEEHTFNTPANTESLQPLLLQEAALNFSFFFNGLNLKVFTELILINETFI